MNIRKFENIKYLTRGVCIVSMMGISIAAIPAPAMSANLSLTVPLDITDVPAAVSEIDVICEVYGTKDSGVDPNNSSGYYFAGSVYGGVRAGIIPEIFARLKETIKIDPVRRNSAKSSITFSIPDFRYNGTVVSSKDVGRYACGLFTVGAPPNSSSIITNNTKIKPGEIGTSVVIVSGKF